MIRRLPPEHSQLSSPTPYSLWTYPPSSGFPLMRWLCKYSGEGEWIIDPGLSHMSLKLLKEPYCGSAGLDLLWCCTKGHLQVLVHYIADADRWDDLHEVRGDAPVKPSQSFCPHNMSEKSSHGHLRSALQGGWGGKKTQGVTTTGVFSHFLFFFYYLEGRREYGLPCACIRVRTSASG